MIRLALAASTTLLLAACGSGTDEADPITPQSDDTTSAVSDPAQAFPLPLPSDT